MPFNSFEYFAFLTCVVALYWALPRRGRPVLLLVSSYIFYAVADWRFVPLLAGSTAMAYLCALGMPAAGDRRRRLLLLAISVGSSALVLVGFKTFSFLETGSTAGGLGISVGQTAGQLLVPIGLSYYTFQTISYCVDVYRREIEPERDPVAFATFVAFFPHLLAGPIVRARRLIPQIKTSPRNPDRKVVAEGLQLLLIGLFKKVAVSEPLLRSSVEAARPAFAGGSSATTATLVVTTFLGILASYFDIAGYVDMARGSAKLMGIEMQANFAQPLTRSTCLTDFWRRWQVTLMAWFRDYVYRTIRGPQRREALALLGTFLAAGLWHGLSGGWVLWGLLTALILIAERRFNVLRRNELRIRSAPSPSWRWFQRMRALAVVWLLLLVTAPWAASARISDGVDFYRTLLTAGLGRPSGNQVAFLVYGVLVLVLNDRFERHGQLAPVDGRIPLLRWPTYGLMIVGVVVFGGSVAQDFLYFQF